jgi:hypothetical protein
MGIVHKGPVDDSISQRFHLAVDVDSFIKPERIMASRLTQVQGHLVPPLSTNSTAREKLMRKDPDDIVCA